MIDKIPCKGCITEVICKQVLDSNINISVLIDKCSILENFLSIYEDDAKKILVSLEVSFYFKQGN
jgi:hypothetical protein